MTETDLICMWIAELVPLSATLFSFVYGIMHFFKKGKPLHLQSLTMGMGCYALGSLYHTCQTLTLETVLEGFTPAYLGHIGFFLFLITASYGHMDRILDDGTPKMKPARYLALVAPALALLLYIPNGIVDDVPASTKITYVLVWLPGMVSVYYNLKHAIIPDMDYGFVKAIRPYNLLAVCLGLSELLLMTAWCYMYNLPLVITSFLFGGLAVATVLAARKGVEKWTI